MASRQQVKAAARHARLAAERAASRRAAQRRRLGIISGVGVLAVIIVAVAIVISSSGTKTGVQTGAPSRAIDKLVARELHAIPQRGSTLGSPNAPVTIQYFGDLECPYCAELTDGDAGSGLPQLITGPVRDGKVKLEYRSMETASASTNNDRFVPQQVAALAAGRQGLFWQYTELFYHEQGDETSRYVTETYLQDLARQIPTLKFTTWMSDRKDSTLVAQVNTDGKLARQYGLPGTPALVATGRDGSKIVPTNASGVQSYASIVSTIKAVS